MRAFLRFVTRGRVHAAIAAGVSLLIPPFSFIAGGIIGLVTLRYGFFDGVVTLAGSVLLAGAVTLVLLHTIDPIVAFLLVTGVPIVYLAGLLRLSSSQSVALVGAGAMGGLALSVIHLLTTDPVLWWRGMLSRYVFDSALTNAQTEGHKALAQVNEMLDVLAPVMVSLPSGVAIAAMIVLFMSRWWQATLDNPGGFAREFRSIRLDARIATVTAVTGVAALYARDTAGGYWPSLFQMLMVLFTVQGVAIIHSITAGRQASVGWLVGTYVFLLVRPREAIILLAVAGFSDTWVNYRQRWGQSV